MKFRVIGGPLTSGVNVEAKHSDTFKSIFNKVQKSAGMTTPLDDYDLFTSIKSGAAGHYTPAAGPLRHSDTPGSLQLDRKQMDPHVLLLVRRDEQEGVRGSLVHSLSHSSSASYGAGDAASEDGGGCSTASTPVSTLRTPRAIESYRRRLQAMFLKYDPEKVNKVDLALEHYAGYEEDVIQRLVKKYGPEPSEDEVDTSLTAIARVTASAAAAAVESTTRGGTQQLPVSARKQPSRGASYHDRLVAIYSTYEPEKLSKVDGTLKRYAGREEEVIQQLVKKYGPEPAINAAGLSINTATPTSPEPRPPLASAEEEKANEASSTIATPTTIAMSSSPTTPAYELTSVPSSAVPADTLPIIPRNLQEDYGSNSASLFRASASVALALPLPASAVSQDSLTYRDRLTAMYATYDPSKIRLVEGTLRKYRGREAAVLKQLVKMYGPEPSPEHVAAAKEAAALAARARKASGNAASSSTALSSASVSGRAEDAVTPASASVPVVEEPESPKVEEKETLADAQIPAAALPAAEEKPSASVAAGKKEKEEQKEYVEEVRAEAAMTNAAVAPAVPVLGEMVTLLRIESHPATTPASASASSPPFLPTVTLVEKPVAAAPKSEETNTKEKPEDVKEEASKEVKTEEQASTKGEKKEERKGNRYRERLVALYNAYNTSKLHTVEGTLKKFAGKEEAAIQQLVRRYGPEPPALSTEEAYKLLKSANSSSPVTSPRSQNASTKMMPDDGLDNSYASVNGSSPVSPVGNTTSVCGGYRSRIHAILAAHDPDKVDKVDLIMSRYQGEEEEAIAKLERRYGLHTDEKVEMSESSAAPSLASPLSFVEDANVVSVPASVPARPITPPPAQVTVELSAAVTPAAAIRPTASAPPAVLEPVKSPVSSSSSEPTKAKVGGSDDDATRPTAPPSQRSSSADISPYQTPGSPLSDDDEKTDGRAPVKELSTRASPYGARRTPAPPAMEQPVVVSVDVVEPTAFHTTAAPRAAILTQDLPPPLPVQQMLQLESPPARQLPQSTPRPKNFTAVADVAAGHLAFSAQRIVLLRYWSTWNRHHAMTKADALVRDKLWVVATSLSSAKECFQLNDAVQPPYTVAELSTVVACEELRRTGSGPTAFSSEMEIAARTLVSALRHCVESRVVDIRSAEEEALANSFLAHWTVSEHLCPVTDCPEFARALHQAAHLIAQLDDLVTVIRTQAGQLQQLKDLHKDVLLRMEAAQAEARDVEQLQAQLDSANAHRRELEEELKRISMHTGISGRSRSNFGQKAGEGCKTSPPTRRVHPTLEERKDAQIAKLQQELAKTRNALFASKEAEEKVKLQVQQSIAREARRERDERRREGQPGCHSRPVSVSPQRRCHSGPAGQRGRPSSGSSSPYRSGEHPVPMATPRGAFSHAIALDTPRRPSESVARVDYNGRAVSSIRKLGLEAHDRSNISVSSNTPWPTSRFVMTEEIERGPCPNCLTPLTSCSADAHGPANAKAAFCFSCRRSFTFGELRACEARDVIANL